MISIPPAVRKLRVAVFINTIASRGGIERIAMYLQQRYKPHFFTGVYVPENTYEELRKIDVTAKIIGKTSSRLTQLKNLLWFRSLDVRGQYDVYIHFGGIGALQATTRHHPVMFYCIMPTSWLYHGYEAEMKRHTAVVRPLWRLFFAILRRSDQKQVRLMDSAFSISGTTRDNLRRYNHVDSKVIYAPTDIDSYYYKPSKGYYLYVGRLEEQKRPHIVLEAFKSMPDKRLVIIGSGALLEKLKAMARGHPNIDVRGPVPEATLRKAYAECIATLYPTQREDYGLVPVEAMASGKPCIVADEGGLRETVLDRKTGLLVKDVTPQSIAKAVRWLTPQRALAMKKACLQRAKLFGLDEFYRRFDEELVRLVHVKQ